VAKNTIKLLDVVALTVDLAMVTSVWKIKLPRSKDAGISEESIKELFEADLNNLYRFR
jgi:hypothetical protein